MKTSKKLMFCQTSTSSCTQKRCRLNQFYDVEVHGTVVNIQSNLTTQSMQLEFIVRGS